MTDNGANVGNQASFIKTKAHNTYDTQQSKTESCVLPIFCRNIPGYQKRKYEYLNVILSGGAGASSAERIMCLQGGLS